MNIIKKIALIALFLSLLPFSFAQAATTTMVDTVDSPAQKMLANTGLSDLSLGTIIEIIIKGALSLLAIIFLIIIVFAGYRWMTASGNEESITKAKGMMTRAVIGLAIVLLAYSITYFVFNQLPFSGAGTDNGGVKGNGNLE